MFSAKVTVDDRKVVARFKRLPDSVRDKVRPAVVAGADEIAEFSRRLVPVSTHGSHGNPPGTLRDSIRVRAGDHDLSREIVAGSDEAWYARWVEFGTPDQPAHPFFFPAYRAQLRRVRRNIANAVRRAIRG